RWMSGEANDGLLLDPGPDHDALCASPDDNNQGATLFFSSEATDASKGPALEVCYVVSPPCLIQTTTAGGFVVSNGGSCLPAPKSGGTGTLTFGVDPGRYTCTITTQPGVFLDGPTGPSGALSAPFDPGTPLGEPFDCSPGVPIPFAGLTDFG